MSIYISNKFSYSKLNTYESCGWKYFLTYEEGHYIYTESIQSSFGTLVHYIEENIASCLRQHKQIDYARLKEDFLNVDIPKSSPRDRDGGIYGVNVLKQQYPVEYLQNDARGVSYRSKAESYLNSGIYRLEKHLKENPDLVVWGEEQFFSITYQNKIFSGYIDRILYDSANDLYIIEDIKTKNKPFDQKDLTVPLQFVIYAKAFSEMKGVPTDKIICNYDLPFLDMRQQAGAAGFVAKGLHKIDSLLGNIDDKKFEPHPSPLCAYCPFSETMPKQPEDAKGLCCYYSLWTPGGNARVWEVAHKWEGIEHNRDIAARFFNKNKTDAIDFDV